MSSAHDNFKKSKARPCDVCRRRKRRCDGGTPCSRCIQYEASCTYDKGAMPRTSTTSRSGIQALEDQLEGLEARLRESNVVFPLESRSSATQSPPGVELLVQAIRDLNQSEYIVKSLDSMSLNTSGFQGQSSQAVLLKAAVDLKATHSTHSAGHSIAGASSAWGIKPDETPPRPAYTFPEDDLTISLISLYFDNIGVFFPLLHRPSFEDAVARTLHLRDKGFAGTLLLVCALGAWYSEDPRVRLATATPGWQWFSQVRLVGQAVADPPTLYDLQAYCLAVQYLERSSGPRTCWTVVGFGIRLAQDIGAHRLKTRRTREAPRQAELEKRAYWLMILLDTQCSAVLGRSFAIQSHQFDQALPVRCDDEYWLEGPHSAAFSQLPETPCRVDFFVSLLDLNKILGFALRVLYTSNRNKALSGLDDPTSMARIVAEFDSVLNAWFEAVPAHLRWEPSRLTDDVFFDQSAALNCMYYFVRILVHRPFIPAIQQPSAVPSTFPALSICNSAARACIHVADIQHRRRPDHPLVFAQTAVFTASIVLLLNVWGGTRASTGSAATDLLDVHRCVGILRGHQVRWPSTGPLLNTLDQLLKVDQVPPTSDQTPVSAPPSARVDENVDFHTLIPGMLGGGPQAGNPPTVSASHISNTPPGFTSMHTSPMDLDTVSMWSAAPTSFEVSDWDLYLNSIADMMQEYSPPM